MQVDLEIVLHFWASGVPVAQGSKKIVPASRRCRTCGVARARMIDNNEDALKRWRKTVAKAAREAWGAREPLDGDLWISCEFVFQRPVGHRDKRGELKRGVPYYKNTAADLDKLIRSLNDALQIEGQILVNDSRIVGMFGAPHKRYGEVPGVEVWIAVPAEKHGGS